MKLILEVRVVRSAQEVRERASELHLLRSIATGIARIAAVLERPHPRVPASFRVVIGAPLPES